MLSFYSGSIDEAATKLAVKFLGKHLLTVKLKSEKQNGG